MSAYKSNLYIDPVMNIIGPSTHVLDLGVSMSSNCAFDLHISNLYTRCSNLAGWILRTFTMRDPLYKSLVMSRFEYTSQLWSYLPNRKGPESFHQTYHSPYSITTLGIRCILLVEHRQG